MPESTGLTSSSTDVQLGFVERESTPRELMRLSIQLHLRGLSLADTVGVLQNFGVDRARSTVHNWVQKADLQPSSGKSPDHVALDETVIQLTDQRYWLYAAVDPATNEFLHVRLFPTRNTAITEMFLAELTEKHDVDDSVETVQSPACERRDSEHLDFDELPVTKTELYVLAAVIEDSNSALRCIHETAAGFDGTPVEWNESWGMSGNVSSAHSGLFGQWDWCH